MWLGESNWLQGLMLLVVYFLIGACLEAPSAPAIRSYYSSALTP